MISIKLLIEVAPEYDFCDDITIDENEFVFWKDGEMHSDINIYELAHKCKEWACSKKYRDVGVWRRYDSDIDEFYWLAVIQIDSRIVPIKNKTFQADTAPEAIFKACEWILELKAKDE